MNKTEISNMNYFWGREFCPACNSTKIETIYSCNFLESPIKEFLESFYSLQGGVEFEYLKGAEFILEECRDCGLIYQKQIPNDSLMNKLYTEWINPKKIFNNDVEANNLDYYIEYAQEIMMLIGYFKTLPSELKFLDFGMGWGAWARMAKAFGCGSYGTELSKEKAEYAKSQGVKIINWDDISDYQFDFIKIKEIFEHIAKPKETLGCLKNSLKPNGLIKISVPDGRDIKRRLKVLDWKAVKGSRNSLNAVSPLEHINCFNRNSLVRMADIAGFKPVKIPLAIQYKYKINRNNPKLILKNILKPLCENTFKRGTELYLSHKSAG